MIIILTIERRMYLAEATKQSLLDNGVLEEDIVIMYGYDKENYPSDIVVKRPYHLVGKAFLERVLPFAIENNSSILYTECGTLFKSNPLELLIVKDKINWLGYIRNTKHYIIGAKLIYFPLNIIKDIVAKPLRLAHVDRMIRNYGLKNDCLEVADKSHITQMDYPSDWGTENQLKKKKILKKTIK